MGGLRFGEFEFRADERTLTRHGQPVRLGARAHDILSYLIDHRDRVVSKAELLDHVWAGLAVEEANLTVQVSALRKELGNDALSTIPGRGYRFVMAVSGVEASPAPAALPVPARPSIAVLPFINMNGDPEQEYFADGLTDEIITTLSKISGLTVIARASSFTYKGRDMDVRQVGRELGVRHVLEGSIRNHGGRMRIAARLIDAETGSHVWAERYDRAFEDMFALQDEIALILVTELQVNLTEGEQARLRRSSIRNMEAWMHWVKGLARFNRAILTREGMTTTLMCWQRAAALDPQAAVIQAMLGMLYYIDARFRYWNDRETALAKGMAHVERALASDPESADAWMVQGLLLLMQGRHDEAVAASRLSLAYAPSSADVAAFAAFVLANAGLGPEAAQEIERAITLCPMFPSYYFGHMGLAYREAGRIPEAIAAFEAYDRNNAGRGVTDLVIMNEQRGERETATRWAGRLRSVFPDFTISGWRNTQFRRDQESLERDIASLRAMGLPEE